MRTVPGPSGSLFLGSLNEYKQAPHEALRRWSRDYGPLMRFRIGPLNFFLLSDPAFLAHVFVDRVANYIKGRTNERMSALLGASSIMLNGEPWRHRRRLIQPAFHRERIASLAVRMAAAAERMVERWRPWAESSRCFDLLPEMTRVTLGIVGETMFSTDISGDADTVGQALKVALHELSERMAAVLPLPVAIPTPKNRRFAAAVRTLDRTVYGLIDRRRHGESAEDLLGMLMAVRDEETGETLSNTELRDETMTLILAGHETTALALSWCFYLLAKNPVVAGRLREEASRVLGDRSVTLADIPNLPYTNLVIQETMRLYPPVWVIGRDAVADDELGGYHIPKGALILTSPYVMQRDPSLWPEPEKFDPERFLPERSIDRPRFAYFPFGGGQRLCIGQQFAILEATIILATVVRRYELRLLPAEDAAKTLESEAVITLRPKTNVPVTAHPVRAAG